MSAAIAHLLGKWIGRIRRLPSCLWESEAKFRGAHFAGPVEFLGRPILTLHPGSEMIFGGYNRIFSSPRANPLGNFQPAVLRTLAAGARLELGCGVGMSGAVLCASVSIIVGEGTILGSGAMVIDNDFHHPKGEWSWGDDSRTGAKPVRIGRGCFIGARAIVLKGVLIGDRAVVGAGAVVTRDVPAHTLAVGNPARLIPLAPP